MEEIKRLWFGLLNLPIKILPALKEHSGEIGTFLQGVAAVVAVVLTIANVDKIAENISLLSKGVSNTEVQVKALTDFQNTLSQAVLQVNGNIGKLQKQALKSDEASVKIQEALNRVESANQQIKTTLLQICELTLKNALINSPNIFSSLGVTWDMLGKRGLVVKKDSGNKKLFEEIDQEVLSFPADNRPIKAIGLYFERTKENPCLE